jgi:hypothetical protein
MHEIFYDPDDPNAFPQDEDPTNTDAWRTPLYTPDGPAARDNQGNHVRFREDGSVFTFTEEGSSQTDPADQAVDAFGNPAMAPIETSFEDPYEDA